MEEDPQTTYEKFLDKNGLDCSMHCCWNPIAAFVDCRPDFGCGRGEEFELGLCQKHALEHGKVIRWLEQ